MNQLLNKISVFDQSERAQGPIYVITSHMALHIFKTIEYSKTQTRF